MRANPPTRLWNRHFTLFLLGTTQSVFGSTLTAVAMAFLVLELTGSAAATGLTIALATLPHVFGPLAGTLVDRMSLRIPLIAGDIAQGVLALVTWVLAVNGVLPVGFIYASALLSGVITVFYRPASEALLPTLVPRTELVRANTILHGGTQTVTLLGYGVSGWLVTAIGVKPALLVDALSFFVMGSLFLLIAMPPVASDPRQQTFLQDLRGGFAALRSIPVLGALVGVGFVVMAAMAPLNMLLPKLSVDLGLSAQGYSSSMMALTVGMIVGSAVIAWMGNRFRARPAVTLGLLICAVFYALLTFAQSIPGLMALTFLLGVGMSANQAGTMYLIQTLTPPQYLGRVFAVVMSSMMLALPLTLFLLAPIADRVQSAAVFAGAAAVILCTVAAWMVLQRQPAAPASPDLLAGAND